MIAGVFIIESLRVGIELAGLPLTVTGIRRIRPEGTTPEQPEVWTLVDFTADDDETDRIASLFADSLDEPGWYADFRTDAETVVAFPGRVFRYPRGDAGGRAAAVAHGRALRIPEPQLDWPV